MRVKKIGMAGDEMEPARSKNAYVRETGYVCLVTNRAAAEQESDRHE